VKHTGQFLGYKQSVAPGAEPVSRLVVPFSRNGITPSRLAYEYKKYEGALTARTVASTLNIVDPSYEQDPAITVAVFLRSSMGCKCQRTCA
jgi:iron complex outermembrane receptor protein